MYAFRTIKMIAGVAIVTSSLLFTACGESTTEPETNTTPGDTTSETTDGTELETIAAIASGNDDFSTLVTALAAADLVETFQGDGDFVAKPGFGVFIGIGSADGESFKWPSFLPIRITEIGVIWPDIQAVLC